MKLIKKILYFFLFFRFYNNYKDLALKDLNFKKLDFTNYKQIKSFIFKKNFVQLNNKYVQNFDFLNFSKILGGKIGINLSKESIISWHSVNKYKLGFPWNEDLGSRRLINIIYNYEFINSSSTRLETKKLNRVIVEHMNRVMFDFKHKNFSEITSYDLLANTLSLLILKKDYSKKKKILNVIIDQNIDNLGMHKSYNVLEHAKFLNNLKELKNILLYFKINKSKNIDEKIILMTSILNEYFHLDGSFPLFHGSNNNYTKIIYESLNKKNTLNRDLIEIFRMVLLFFQAKIKNYFLMLFNQIQKVYLII